MTKRIFMSVPDGAYWRMKEERERARQAGEELEAVRSPARKRVQQRVRRADNER